MGTEPMVEAREVNKTYDASAVRVDALQGVDLVVERGEMVAIMGPSGCGKTTLLNCLSGLDAIDGGDVQIEGRSLASMSDRERTDYRAATDGLRVPVLQPDARPHRGRERRAAAPRRPCVTPRGKASGGRRPRSSSGWKIAAARCPTSSPEVSASG